MLAEIKPLLNWLQLHPHWGGCIAGCIALLESLVVVGLLVPGTIMMTAIGTLIGAGVLPFYTTTAWAIGGAIIGDVFSFWIGMHYHARLKEIWPFRTYPKILEKGEPFFLKHGRKGIFFGRFLGPIRPILPAIAGMMSMPIKAFLLADITSAILWAPVYMLPGILLGAASQELPPETATKLLLIVAAILLVVWCLSWLLKRLYHYSINLLDQSVAWLWKFTVRHPRLTFIKTILLDPTDPHNHKQFSLALMLLLAALLFIALTYNVLHQGPLLDFNTPVYYFMRSLRTTTTDNIFITITLIAPPVYLGFWFAVLAALTWQRHWQAALHWLGLGLLVFCGTELLKHIFHNPRPLGLTVTPNGWSFPSGHSALSTALFGFFAILVTRQSSIYWRWVVYSFTVLLISTIMFSRVYLGAHWLTDVIGGGLFGFMCVAFVTLAYRRHSHKPLALMPLAITALLSIGIIWGSLVYSAFNKALHDYTPVWTNQIVSQTAWWAHTSQQVPPHRINRFGKPIQYFNIQWAGDLLAIQKMLNTKNWQTVPKASLLSVLNEITGKENGQQAFIMSQFYEDKKPVLVMTKHAGDAHALLVLRLWNAHLVLDNQQPLWLGTVSYHKTWYAKFLKQHPAPNLPDPTELLRQDLTSFVYTQQHYSPEQAVLFIQAK